MRLLSRYRFHCLRIHNLEILPLHHLRVGLLLNLMRLLWRMMFSLIAVAVGHQVRVKNSLLTLVINVIIWNLLILHLIYHWCSLIISISGLKDILIRDLRLLLRLLPLGSIHMMNSRRLMTFAHVLKSEDWLRLVAAVVGVHCVMHRILFSSLLLILLLLMNLLLRLLLCLIVIATRFTLMHTGLFRNRSLGLSLIRLGIIHLCKDSSCKGFVRNVKVLTLEEAIELIAQKSIRNWLS